MPRREKARVNAPRERAHRRLAVQNAGALRLKCLKQFLRRRSAAASCAWESRDDSLPLSRISAVAAVRTGELCKDGAK